MWTPERVRAELPAVRVKLPGGEVTNAAVSGRELTFPVVRWHSGSAEWSWKAVAHALNTGKPLTY